MFLFEGAGHTVLHSGDFRGTGYMGKSIDLIPKIIHEKYGKEVDVLLTEGTMMTRSTEKEHLFTEWEVHKEAKAFMKDHRQIFVVCSSTNFDSLTSICNAARANHIPIYGRPYIIEMMKTFKNMAEKYRPQLPYVQSIDKLGQNSQQGFVYLLGSLSSISKEGAHKLFHKYENDVHNYQLYLLYSMWQGYLDEMHPAFNEGLKAFVGEFDGRVKYIHSTGHADKGTLAKFIQDIAPRKFIVPFHTEDAGGFKSLEIEEKYKDMVILPDDGDTIELA
jgi:ribonuclease J